MRKDLPTDHPDFGKLFRCPRHHVDIEAERIERLRRLSNLEAYQDRTFENFEPHLPMVTDAQHNSLEVAYNVAMNFAHNPDGWLVLEGGYGCGKTHLAAAIGNLRLAKGDPVLFITTPDLLDHLRSTYSPSAETTYDAMFDRIRNAPLLILDDLGVEKQSQWAQEKLFQLLNHRYMYRLATVITTNADLDSLDPRVRSRLLDLALIRRVIIAAPDYRTGVQNQNDLLMSHLSMYRHMTFETFDVKTHIEPWENLGRALELARAYAAEHQGSMLILNGHYGTGKTHLAAAIANYWAQNTSNVTFITVPDLLDYLRVTFSPSSNVTFDKRFHMIRDAPYLILDDLGTENATSWAKEKLFQIIDHRYVMKLPTVITTAKRIEDLDERLHSRLLDDRYCTIFALNADPFVWRLKR